MQFSFFIAAKRKIKLLGLLNKISASLRQKNKAPFESP